MERAALVSTVLELIREGGGRKAIARKAGDPRAVYRHAGFAGAARRVLPSRAHPGGDAQRVAGGEVFPKAIPAGLPAAAVHAPQNEPGTP